MTDKDKESWSLKDVLGFAGTENLDDAVLLWQVERDTHEALVLRIENVGKVQKALWEIIDLCGKLMISILESSALMFLPPKANNLIELINSKVEAAKKLAAELGIEPKIKRADSYESALFISASVSGERVKHHSPIVTAPGARLCSLKMGERLAPAVRLSLSGFALARCC